MRESYGGRRAICRRPRVMRHGGNEAGEALTGGAWAWLLSPERSRKTRRRPLRLIGKALPGRRKRQASRGRRGLRTMARVQISSTGIGRSSERPLALTVRAGNPEGASQR